MYDTLFCDINTATRCLLTGMFGSKVAVYVSHVKKQSGHTDCGVFAIAIATSLLYKIHPIHFQHAPLCPHLIHCFVNHCISPFP